MTLRVTLEIIPFGDEEAKRTIHTFNISNLGPVEEAGRGTYGYTVEHNEYKQGNGYYVEHKRDKGAITLVRKALRLYENNK